MDPVLEERLLRIASRQHGVVARWQLADAGIPALAVDDRIRRRRLEPAGRAVYRVPGLSGPRTAEAAAVLSFGRYAVASHGTAGALHGLIAHPGKRMLTVSVSRGNPRRRAGVTVHRVRFDVDEICVCDGVPATTPARTLLDLGAVLAERELEQAVAAAIRLERVTREAVLALLNRYPTRQGTRALRSLLDPATQLAFTRSVAEEKFLRLIRRAALPAPVTNTKLHGMEPDFYWPTERLVVEIDGLAYHSSPAAQQRDRERNTVLGAAGIRVLRFTWHDLTRRHEAVLVQLAMALSKR